MSSSTLSENYFCPPSPARSHPPPHLISGDMTGPAQPSHARLQLIGNIPGNISAGHLVFLYKPSSPL